MTAAGPKFPLLRGKIVWAVTTFQPEGPFRVVDAKGDARSFSTVDELASAIANKEVPVDHEHVLKAKIRPVLVLQDRPHGRLLEYAALKLVRLDKLGQDSQRLQEIRDHRDTSLFHLPALPQKYGLQRENAVDINSLVRIHEDAILYVAGSLDANEIDVVGRRLTAALDIDLSRLIQIEAVERLRLLRDPH